MKNWWKNTATHILHSMSNFCIVNHLQLSIIFFFKLFFLFFFLLMDEWLLLLMYASWCTSFLLCYLLRSDLCHFTSKMLFVQFEDLNWMNLNFYNFLMNLMYQMNLKWAYVSFWAHVYIFLISFILWRNKISKQLQSIH